MGIFIQMGRRICWVARVRAVPIDGAELNICGMGLPHGLYRLRLTDSKVPAFRAFPVYTIERIGDRKPGMRMINLHFLEN